MIYYELFFFPHIKINRKILQLDNCIYADTIHVSRRLKKLVSWYCGLVVMVVSCFKPASARVEQENKGVQTMFHLLLVLIWNSPLSSSMPQVEPQRPSQFNTSFSSGRMWWKQFIPARHSETWTTSVCRTTSVTSVTPSLWTARLCLTPGRLMRTDVPQVKTNSK